MNNTILIKRHPSVQLAHLYEHLFLIEVNEMLNKKGIFKWLDYSLVGTTYEQGGVISVDFKTYNDIAANSLKDIQQLRIVLTESRITKALMQLRAEEYYDLTYKNFTSIIKQLQILNEEEWLSLDELSLVDTHDNKRSVAPLHLNGFESGQPITTKISLEIDSRIANEEPLTVPLFGIIARVILLTATYDIAKETGSYSYRLNTQLSGRRVVADILTAAVLRSHAPRMHDAGMSIQSTASNMINAGAFTRLAKDLGSTSYLRNSSQAPNYEEILFDTGILVGSKAWKSVSEIKIQNILKNIHIKVKRSRNVVRMPLMK